VLQLLSPHTREKDAEAIRYHYDVSNEFYSNFLDPAMVYSCAYFENGDEDLATAQLKKIDHILTKIGLQRGQSLLDIGCGWGALVIRAAAEVRRALRRRHAVREPVRAGARTGGAGRAAGPQSRSACRTTATSTASSTASPASACSSTSGAAPGRLLRPHRPLLAPGGVAMNHGITTTDVDQRASPFGGGSSSTSTCSRTANWRTCRR
jgi:cyclopropane-fatty-acyl-phospholipid synthase